MSNDVSLYEVLEWAQVQAQHLTPTQHHVLLYLTINSFRRAENPEGAEVGQVLSGRTSLAKIRMGTGLSQRAVQNALNGLQDHCYIIAEMSGGRGTSRILVFWSAKSDALRNEIRAGVSTPPKPFQRAPKKTPKKPVAGVVLTPAKWQ